MQSAAAFSRAACAEVGCKSLGTFNALTDTPAELQAGIDEVNEIKVMIEAAKTEKKKLQKQYELALEVFEGYKKRCDRQRRPVPHSVGREYLLSYDRYQIADESLDKLKRKLRECKRSSGNPLGFQGHSTPR